MTAVLSFVLLSLLLSTSFPSVARAQTPTIAPVTTITSVPTYNPISTITYDPTKGEIFVQYVHECNDCTDWGTGIVAVISDGTNKAIGNITEKLQDSIGYIGDVVYDSGKGEVFAAYGNAKPEAGVLTSTPYISVISDSNNSLVATIASTSAGSSWPIQPTGMVYDSGKGEMFVTDVQSNDVYVISDQSNTVVATIGVKGTSGGGPYGWAYGGMAYDSAKGEVFVANSNQISVISDSTNEVVANISVSTSSLVYDASKGEVFDYYLGEANLLLPPKISVISDSTNTVVATISQVKGGVTSIAYDSGKGLIFAGSVISDSTNTIVAQLSGSIQNIVYDSGKGEIIATTPSGLDVFSDSSISSSSSSTAATSTTTPLLSSTTTLITASASSSGSGGIPEFPHQLLTAILFTTLLAVGYMVVRLRAQAPV